MKAVFALFISILISWSYGLTVEQVHSAWTGKGVTELAVNFVTEVTTTTQDTIIYYGTSSSSLTEHQTGVNYKFGTDGHYFRIHNVIATNLKPNTRYYYKVGDEKTKSYSQVFSFYTKATGLTYAVYGDFGEENDRSLNELKKETQVLFDAVLHVGDFAYNLNSQDGVVGDKFMNNIEPIAAKVPYMGLPGNHEEYQNFTHFINRFSLFNTAAKNSGSQTPLWYSFDMDQIHFVAIDTEVYAYYSDPHQIQNQLNWLEKDLKKANDNRKYVPWIVMMGHKGFFMGAVNFTGFGDLGHQYGVDLYLCGHVHNYQRFLPYFHGSVDKQNKDVYTNPKFMVTIVAGSAGCHEDISHDSGPADVLVTKSDSYGYGYLHVYNSTHLNWKWEQTSTENSAKGAVKDEFWIVQHNHGLRV